MVVETPVRNESRQTDGARDSVGSGYLVRRGPRESSGLGNPPGRTSVFEARRSLAGIGEAGRPLSDAPDVLPYRQGMSSGCDRHRYHPSSTCQSCFRAPLSMSSFDGEKRG